MKSTSVFPVLFLFATVGGCGGSGSSGPPHSVGGTVSGLSGSGLVLLDNGGDALKVATNGTFTFPTLVGGGDAYGVTVSTQPSNPSQSCAVAHGSGTISGSDVTNVAVTCTTDTFTIGGTVSGLSGSGLVLSLNGGNDKSIAAGGSFTLAPAIASGSAYAVSVVTQPNGPPQTCTLANASGTVGAAAITNVSVTCTTKTYAVGGYVAGLLGSGLALSYNGGAPQAVSRNGYFSVASGIATGVTYNVTIAAQPTGPAQTCTLNNGGGTVGIANVASVTVYCPQAVGQWAYVATGGSITIVPGGMSIPGTLTSYAIDANSGALSMVGGGTVPTGPAVVALYAVPQSTYLWALSLGDIEADDQNFVSSVYAYTANPSSGLLTASSSNPFFTLNGPPNDHGEAGSTVAVTFGPSGAFGYATNSASGPAAYEATWVVNLSSGTPASLGAQVIGTDDRPVVIDPSGQFAYYTLAVPFSGALVGCCNYQPVAATVDPQTGAVTAIPNAPSLPVQGSKGPVTVDPFGRFVYLLDGDLIYEYVIDPASGLLTAVAGSPISFPSASDSLVISPDGKFAYVAATDGVYTYAIDSGSGALSAVGVPLSLQVVDTAAYGTAVQLDPSGQYLYVSANAAAQQVGIYVYSRNPGTGALTLVAGSPFAAASQAALPFAIVQ
jgi:6-phosphogluconolactonase (cycloisomerase 2 family)